MKLDYTVLLAALAFGLAMLPVVQYLLLGFRERRHEIIHYFDSKAITEYFSRYFPAQPRGSDWNPERAFQGFYDRRFGFRAYFPALAIYSAILLVAVSIMVGAAFGTLGGVAMPALLNKLPIAAALAGAYVWVFTDILSRFQTRDIVPSMLYQGALRFGIAVPLAYSIGSLFIETNQIAIAFMLGAFPTKTLFLLMRRLVGQKIGLGNEATTEKHELEQIQGINTALAEKFADYGVSTLLQLAYEDPMQLTMRMNLPFRDIIDMMSQALAALYLPSFEVWRRYLVRSSVDCGIICQQLRGEKGPELQKLAKVQVEAIAADLKVSPEIVEKIMLETDNDSVNRFFMSLPW
jgi:hypothetical protein